VAHLRARDNMSLWVVICCDDVVVVDRWSLIVDRLAWYRNRSRRCSDVYLLGSSSACWGPILPPIKKISYLRLRTKPTLSDIITDIMTTKNNLTMTQNDLPFPRGHNIWTWSNALCWGGKSYIRTIFDRLVIYGVISNNSGSDGLAGQVASR
jgi:hypothetical protein